MPNGFVAALAWRWKHIGLPTNTQLWKVYVLANESSLFRARDPESIQDKRRYQRYWKFSDTKKCSHVTLCLSLISYLLQKIHRKLQHNIKFNAKRYLVHTWKRTGRSRPQTKSAARQSTNTSHLPTEHYNLLAHILALMILFTSIILNNKRLFWAVTIFN